MNREAGSRRASSWLLDGLWCLFVLSGIVLAYGFRYPSSNHAVEVPPILAMLNPDLYIRDFYVQEMLRFTPRTYYNLLMVVLAKTGLGLTLAFVVAYLAALVSMLRGLRAIARLVDGAGVGAVLFIFWALCTRVGLIGEITFWSMFPLPFAFAMGFGIWGAYFSLRRRWVVAYAFFGAACLLHFLIGVLPALLVAPLLLADVWQTRRWGVAVLALGCLALGAGLVYVPMLLQSTTSTALLTNQQFIEIYAYGRHPHHTVPSFWPVASWVQMILFYGGGAACILQARVLSKAHRIGLLVVVAGTAVWLVINYLFVEVWPLALVAKLQPARMTAFSQLAVLIGLLALFSSYRESGHVLACVLIAVISVSHIPGLLLLVLVLISSERVRTYLPATSKAWLVVLGIVVLYRWPLSSDPVLWLVSLVEGPLLLGVLLAPWLAQQWVSSARVQMVIAAGLVVLIGGVLTVGLSGMLPPRLDRLFAKHVTIDGVWDNEVGPLARRFRSQSPRDALVLTPPSVQHFRLYAARAVVVDEKAFPFTDAGMLEWQERMDAVAGFATRPAADVLAMARRFGAGYVLSRLDWHPDMPGHPIDQQGVWAIWEVPVQKKTRVDGRQ